MSYLQMIDPIYWTFMFLGVKLEAAKQSLWQPYGFVCIQKWIEDRENFIAMEKMSTLYSCINTESKCYDNSY